MMSSKSKYFFIYSIYCILFFIIGEIDEIPVDNWNCQINGLDKIGRKN